METIQYFMHMVMGTYYRLTTWLFTTWRIIVDNYGLLAWLTLFAFGLISAIAAMMT